MFVENEGDYEKASKNCKWGDIAIKMGFKELTVVNLMVIYQGYLDMMSWKYQISKNGECGEPSCPIPMNEESVDRTVNLKENDKMETEDIPEDIPEVVPEEVKNQIETEGIKNEELIFEMEDFDDADVEFENTDLGLEDYEILEDYLTMDEGSIPPAE
ncbi:hypothetical protein E3N88_15519 [Mikania micrantha]|uniref:ARID domain-containing protein n=1 Tax=Mikania micrantha TaxID=192012 RepID=A0A5N6NVU2_9ASTR|nr:hypothetical protein E3N88_15519 [Mikania micrantha]